MTQETTQTYTALIKESGDWWIGWIKEVRGVTCQERTRTRLLDTLKITLGEFIADNIAQPADNETEHGFEEVEITPICLTSQKPNRNT